MTSLMVGEYKTIPMEVLTKETLDQGKNKEEESLSGLMEQLMKDNLKMGLCKDKVFTNYQMGISTKDNLEKTKGMEEENSQLNSDFIQVILERIRSKVPENSHGKMEGYLKVPSKVESLMDQAS